MGLAITGCKQLLCEVTRLSLRTEAGYYVPVAVIAGPDPQSWVRVVLLEEKAWIPDQVRDDNRRSGMTVADPG